MKKRNTIIVMLLSVIALTSCLDTLKQYCFHMYPNDYEYNDEYHYVICKICKDGKKEEHEFDEPYIVEYPTEDKKGLQEYYCIHCPYTKTEEIDKLVHEHSYDWTFTYENHWKEAKCGCDLEYLEYGPHTSDYEYETYQYKIQDATCMNGSKYFYTCRCGWHTLETFELDDKLDHKFINYTSLEDGSKISYCEYGCGTTDIIQGTEHVHVFNVKDAMATHFAAEANCQHGLLFYYSCECDANGIETFEVSTKLEHKYINYIYNNDATEYEDGTETASCEYGCGEIHTRIKEGSALGHIHVYDQKIESWETWAAGGDCQHGTIFFKSCICGEIGTETFDDGKPQPHNFTSYHYNNDATEYEDGTETAYCDYGCGTTDTRVVIGSALGHTHVFNVENTLILNQASSATCEHGTGYYYMCACGEVGTEIFYRDNKLDHNFGIYYYNNDATETEDGTETAFCVYGCGTTDTRVKPNTQLGHVHVFNVKDGSLTNYKESGTCYRGSIWYYVCKCGERGTEADTYTDDNILEHRFEEYNYTPNGQLLSYCEYDCGMMSLNGQLHTHEFDQTADWDYLFYKSANCQHGILFYHSCVCGEKGTVTFEVGLKLDHVFFDYYYDNNATLEEDGTETAHCYYGCGETDTRVKEGTCLGHVHEFNVKNNGDWYIAESPNCSHGWFYYYACQCGEKGTETYEVGEPADHYLTISYIWSSDNSTVKGVATCMKNCGYETTEEVETDITINYQPKTTQAGSGTYVTRPFENGIFVTQYKQFEIKPISLVDDSNSVYGRTYFEGFENDGFVNFYDKMYQLSVDFYESTEDLESSLDGLYVLGIIDAVEYGLSIEEAFSVWSIFYTENPVFYFLSNYVYCMGDSLILCVDPSYATFEYRDQCNLAISEMVNKCGEFIGNSIEELVIARAIHDYIITNMDYAYENDGQTPQDDIWAHNIVGISLYNYGVCETYAKTYLMLCLIFGLDCIIVTGDAGGAHAWNYVNINGGWYGVDCTWDDAGEWGIMDGYFANNNNITSGRNPYGNSVFGINYLYDLPELSNINVL